ncbi:hypothetical protein CO613_04125 [Lysobacteraceae bacterium NML07-0707]|nr:hypothetical protein CO613_04125 [Xanthomonadaceae bacterium NML07-0707]
MEIILMSFRSHGADLGAWWKLTPVASLLLFLAFSVAVCVFYHHGYVGIVTPDVAYMDTLRLITYYDEMERGNISIRDVWATGAHRGLIAQFILNSNVEIFNLDILLANLASGWVICATAIMIAIVYTLGGEDKIRMRLRDLLFFLILLISMYSLASFEVMTLDFGLTLFLKNIIFISYFIFLAFSLRQESVGLGYPLLAGLLSLPIILLVGMGWSYAFVLACVFMLALFFRKGGGRPLRALIPGAFIILSIALYVFLGNGVGVSSGGHGVSGDGWMFNSIKSFVLGFFSVFWGVEVSQSIGVPEYFCYFGGGVLFLLCSILLIRAVLDHRREVFFPYVIMVYGIGCIFSIAISRGASDPSLSQASRYFMDYVLVFIGASWVVLNKMGKEEGPGWRLVQVLWGMCVILFFVGQGVTQFHEWQKAPYRAYSFDAMRQAALAGEVDANVVSIFQGHNVDSVRSAFDIQRKRRLSIFSGIRNISCDESPFSFGKGWFAEEPGGRWMSAESELKTAGCLERISLYFYHPENLAERELLVLDSDGSELARHLLIHGSSEFKLDIGKKQGSIYFRIYPVPEVVPGSPDKRVLGAFLVGYEGN